MYKLHENLRKSIAPILFIISILVIELHRGEVGIFYTSALIFPLLVFMAVANGTLAGFLGAAIASAYTFYVTPDPIRALIVTVSFLGMAAIVGYLNAHIKAIDTVEALIHRMRVVHALLLTNLVNWPDMDDEEKWRMVEQINEEMSDIMLTVRGWHILAQEKESLDKE